MRAYDVGPVSFHVKPQVASLITDKIVGLLIWDGSNGHEPLILMPAVDMIRDAGFEPLWASNAEEAISMGSAV